MNGSVADPLRMHVERLGRAKLPVLRESVEVLHKLMEREDEVSGREVAAVVLRDPMLVVQVIRHLQSNRSRRIFNDITTIDHALMMLGVSRFFDLCRQLCDEIQAVEEVLADQPQALTGLSDVVSRARHAALHARSWAEQRADIESDEIVVATMLHDLAEMLIWIFEPAAALEIARRQRRDPALRSADAQRAVLGFALVDLQQALCGEWHLPDLLLDLMDSQHARHPRSRTVLLAVALARHSAHGWTDAALPDDITDVADLLRLSESEVRSLVYRTDLRALNLPLPCGDRAMWLTPPPALMNAGTAAAGHPQRVAHVLDSIGDGRRPQREQPATGPTSDGLPGTAVLDAMAVALHGLRAALDLRRVAWLVADTRCNCLRPVYVIGDREAEEFRSLRLALPAREHAAAVFGAVRASATIDELRQNMASLARAVLGAFHAAGNILLFPVQQAPDADWALVYGDVRGPDMDETRLAGFRDIVHAFESRLRAIGAEA